MKIKLPSIPIKDFPNRLTERLPRLNLSPLTDRLAAIIQPVSSTLTALNSKLRFVWPILAIAALIGLAVLAIRLGPALPAVAMPGELARLNLVAGQEVILWYAMDHAAERMLVTLADEFNATNPWRITVVPQSQGNYARLRQRLNEAVTHNATPDLVALYPYHVAAYAATGHIVALDSYLDHPTLGLTRTDLDDFIPGLLEGERNPQLDNRLMSFPIGPDVLVLVYNLDWLRNLGYQSPPLTWGTFKEVCKQAVSDTNGDGEPDTFGYAFVADAPTFAALVLTRGGTLLSADGRRVLFNSLEGEKGLRVLYETFNAHCAYTVPGRGWDLNDWSSARVLFNIAPGSALPAYRAAIESSSAFRWGVTLLPYTSPEPVTPLHGQSWAILQTTPERQRAAWLFVRWLAESRQTQRWAMATYTLPVRRSAVAALQEMQDLDPELAQVLALAPYGRPEPTVAGWEAVNQIVLEAMQAVTHGADPKAALEQAEKAANAAVQAGSP